MSNNFKSTDKELPLAFQDMVIDILGTVLRSADNPGNLSLYFTEQLREFTGARTIILLQCLHGFGGTGHRIVCVNPDRRRPLAESTEIDHLAGLTHGFKSSRVWSQELGGSEAEKILAELGCGLSIAVPLNVGTSRMGVFLLLDLPYLHHISQVVEVLDMLSTIVALIFRNSLLYEKQEAIIEKRTHELKESELLFRTLAQVVPVGIFLVDIEGHCLYANEQLCQITGLTSEEVFKKCWFQGVHPYDQDRVMKEWHQAIEERLPFRSEFRFQHPDGTMKWVFGQAVPRKGNFTKIISYIGAFTDITESKQAEEELGKYRSHLEELVKERSAQLIVSNELLQQEIAERKQTEEKLRKITYDLKERIKELNCLYGISHLVEKKGISLEEILQRTVDLIPTAWQYSEIICARIMIGDQEFRTKNFTETIWKQDYNIIVYGDQIGSLEIYSLEEKPESDEGSFLKEERSLMSAITERLGRIIELKWTEEALIKSEEKYRALLNEASDAIFHVDYEGNMVETNKKTEELLGYTKEELLQMNMIQIHPKEELEKNIEAFKETMEKGRGSCTDTLILRKDSKTVPVDITGCVVEYGGQKAIQGIFRDITERKKLEEELQKIQKLESIGILAGGIAHDYNNLLTAIIGNLSLAELYIQTDSYVFELLQEVKKASQQTKRLTQQLITFSQGGAPVKEIASVAKLLKDTAGLALSGSNIRCNFFLPHDLWCAEMDQGQMVQAIGNLLINAGEAMPKGGLIDVFTENVIVSAEDGLPLTDGKYVRLSVRDHGVGIPEEHLPKIFDPYFTTKEKGRERGSGLGLAITYSIIKRHGGYIKVKSEVGVGTTFTIYLPASEREISVLKLRAIP